MRSMNSIYMILDLRWTTIYAILLTINGKILKLRTLLYGFLSSAMFCSYGVTSPPFLYLPSPRVWIHSSPWVCISANSHIMAGFHFASTSPNITCVFQPNSKALMRSINSMMVKIKGHEEDLEFQLTATVFTLATGLCFSLVVCQHLVNIRH